ncbi:MAG: hypothetical protein QXD23_00030 [Candidatus Micrarchaeaceae archaeon]
MAKFKSNSEKSSKNSKNQDLSKTKEELKNLIKQTKQEAHALSLLTFEEKNPYLSKIIADNLHVVYINLSRSNLQLGLGNVDNWSEAKKSSIPLLRRDNKNKENNKKIIFDMYDMVAYEAVPLIELSTRIVNLSKDIFNKSKLLKSSGTIIEFQLLNSIFFASMEINIMSEELKTKR